MENKIFEFNIDGTVIPAKIVKVDGKDMIGFEFPADSSPKGGTMRYNLIDYDEEGNAYTVLPHFRNLLAKPAPSNMADAFLRSIFDGLPADALQYVFDGIADAVLKQNKLYFAVYEIERDLYPIYFLDREVGKRMREKTIEGWEGGINYKWIVTRIRNSSLIKIKNYLRDDFDKDIFHFTDKELPGLSSYIVDPRYDVMFAKNIDVKTDGKIKAYNLTIADHDFTIPETTIKMFDTKEEAEKWFKNYSYQIEQFLILN